MAEEKRAAEDAIVVQDPATAQLILGGRGSLYPGSEVEYWRQAYTSEPYFEAGREFEDYGPAYELGWTGYDTYGGEFETADRVLANDWIVQKGVSGLSWEEARPACRAAWQRAHNAKTYGTDGSLDVQEVIETLRELVANAHDGDLGFMEAASHTATPGLSAFFERCAQSCRADCAELQEHVARLGGEAEESGTVTAAAHRVWLQIRGLFGGAGDEKLLAECERGYEAALSRYRKALQQNLPEDIHAMVLRQFESTQRHHDVIKMLLARERAQTEMRARQAA